MLTVAKIRYSVSHWWEGDTLLVGLGSHVVPNEAAVVCAYSLTVFVWRQLCQGGPFESCVCAKLAEIKPHVAALVGALKECST